MATSEISAPATANRERHTYPFNRLPLRKRMWPHVLATVLALLFLAVSAMFKLYAGQPLLIILVVPILLCAHFHGLQAGLSATAVVTIGSAYLLVKPSVDAPLATDLLPLRWLVLPCIGLLTSILLELRRPYASPSMTGSGFIKRSRVYIGLGIASLCALTIGTYTFQSMDLLHGTKQSNLQITTQMEATHALLGLLDDLEISQRDYLLSNDERNLKPYLLVLAKIPASIESLAAAFRASPDNERQLVPLQQLLAQRLTAAKAFLTVQREGFSPALSDTTRTDPALHDSIRAAMDLLVSDLHNTLAAHQAETARRIKLTRHIIVFGSVLILSLVSLLFYWIENDFALNRRLHSTLNRVRNSLERRVERRTAKLKAAYRESQDREERLRLVLESAGDAFWDWNIEQNTVFYSPRWLHMRGMAEQDIRGTPDDWLENIHPDDRQRVEKALQAQLTNDMRFDCDYRIYHKGGHWLWIHDRATAHRDAQGKPVRMTGTQTDISPRKRLAEALHDSATFNRQIVANISTGVVVLDSRRRYVLWNEGMTRLTGTTESELLGQPFECPQSCLNQPAILEQIEQCLRGEPCEELETPLVGALGSRWVIAFGSALRNTNATIVGVILAIHDVTARKHSDLAIEQLNAQLRQLNAKLLADLESERKRIAQALHDETGQGLVALRLQMDRLLKRCPPGSDCANIAPDMLSTIDSTAEGLRRIFSGLRPLQLERTGIVAAVRGLLTNFESSSGIAVDFVTVGDFADLDEDRSITLYRTLQEALTNIAKHADATEVHIVLSAKPEQIALSVQDNGRGIVMGAESYGLLGIRERATHWHGHASVTKGAEGGTCVSIELPTGNKTHALTD